jgi:uncharacterized protein (DUF58 family)
VTRVTLAPAPITARGQPLGRISFAVAPRGFLLMGVGFLWLIPAWFDRSALIGLVAWDLIVVGAWMLDARRLPHPSRLEVSRTWGGVLVLGGDQRVELSLSNHGTVSIRADLIDQPAPVLRRDIPSVSVAVLPGDRVSAGYSVRPDERGDLLMGITAVRYRSGWGLVVRWASASLEQTVRVYPNVPTARSNSLYLLRSRQLGQEKRRARRFGLGREFESLREHREGDEVRDICWTASARRGRVITKVYQPERSQVVWMVVDSGRLQRARIGARAKLDHAVDGAVALAHVAMVSGDRVGLIAYGRRIQQRVAPGRGTAHMRLLLDALALVTGESVEADHARAASVLLASQKPRALVAWLSDVPETAGVPEVIEILSQLTSRHLVLFAAMRHPDIADLAAHSPENAADMYRVLAAQEVLNRRDALLRGLRQHGVLGLELAPHDLVGAVVDRYLTIKERGLL